MSDDLNAARGVVNGLILSALIWGAVIGLLRWLT